MGKPDLKPLSQFSFLPAAFLKSSVSVVNFRCLLPDKTLVSVCVHAYSDFFFSPSPLGPCVLAKDRTEQREREESTHMPVARPSTFLINVLKERKHTHTRKKKQTNQAPYQPPCPLLPLALPCPSPSGLPDMLIAM